MHIVKYIKTLFSAGAMLVLLTAGCDAPNRDEMDEEAGTSRAIVGDSSNLNVPRKTTITGDSATTEEQQDRFGDMPSNQQPPERVKVE